MTPYTPVPSAPTYTADKALETIGMGRFQYLIILLTGLCCTAESMEMLLLSYIKLPIQCTWGITDAQASLITTSVGIGMLTGSTTFGLLADKFGRRLVFILSTFITFALGLVSAISPNYWTLLLARGGVGFGIAGGPVSFTLLTEFLPSTERGTWGMGISFFWSLGAIFESLIALIVLPTLGWRWLIAISTLPMFIVLLLAVFVKESPRWLASVGRIDEAQRIIQRVAESNAADVPHGDLVAAEDAAKGGFRELFKDGARSLAAKVFVMWLACAFLYYGLVMLQPELIAQENAGRRCVQYGRTECHTLKETDCTGDQLCKWDGSQCAAAFGRFLLRADGNDARENNDATTGDTGDTEGHDTKKEAMEDTANPPKQKIGAAQNARSTPEEIKREACATQLSRKDFISTLLSSIGEFPGVFLSLWFIDVIGRRPVIGYNFGLTGILTVVLLACVGRTAETIIFFIARGTSSGAFQSCYLFTSEIYPARIRGMAMGISSSIARVGLIATPLVAQTLTNINLPAALWTYFGVAFMAVLAVLLTPIETTGRPLLESMDELVDLLRGEKVDTQGSFARDPGANWMVRFLRWNAKVDGGATAALAG